MLFQSCVFSKLPQLVTDVNDYLHIRKTKVVTLAILTNYAFTGDQVDAAPGTAVVEMKEEAKVRIYFHPFEASFLSRNTGEISSYTI